MESRNSLPILYTTGSHYEVGYDIGRTFSSRIRTFCAKNDALANRVIPFFQTKNGLEIYEEYLTICTEYFPQYIEEIRGTSDGSGESFENLFLMNLINEMTCLQDLAINDSKGCTDILINRPGCSIIAHTEDYGPPAKGNGYMVQARIVSDTDKEEFFMSYCHPGCLPGNAFAFNQNGVIISGNALYPKVSQRRAVPIHFLSRALMGISSAEDGKEILSNANYGVSYGFNYNIGSILVPESMHCIEVAPGKTKTLINVNEMACETNPTKPCHYYHVNTYKHLDIPECAVNDDVISSHHRTRRMGELQGPRTERDAKTILGDTENHEHPIYRIVQPTDSSDNVATAIFDLLRRRMDVYVGNPKYVPMPLFSTSLILQYR